MSGQKKASRENFTASQGNQIRRRDGLTETRFGKEQTLFENGMAGESLFVDRDNWKVQRKPLGVTDKHIFIRQTKIVYESR